MCSMADSAIQLLDFDVLFHSDHQLYLALIKVYHACMHTFFHLYNSSLPIKLILFDILHLRRLYCSKIRMSKRTILHVEGIGWKTTLKDLITCFQYAKNIQLKVTRPLDPDNLRVMLEFDSEKSYRLDELEDKISKGSCQIEEKKVKKVDKS